MHEHTPAPHGALPTRTLRQQVHSFLDPGDGMSRAELAFNILLGILIVTTIVTTLMGTLPQFKSAATWIRAFDITVGLIFITEYALRVWVVPERLGRAATGQDYLRYVLSPLPVIDLVVALSMLTPAIWALGALRGLRLLKLLSLLKLGRYSGALNTVGQVLRARSGELITLITIVMVLTFIAGSLLWQIESQAGTKGFESIPAALWWAVVTLTTTGYGDVYPMTTGGKMLAGLIMLFGVGMVALPAGIVASGFQQALNAAPLTPGLHYSFPDGHDLAIQMNAEQAAAAQAEWSEARAARRSLIHHTPEGVIDLSAAYRTEYRS